MSLLAWLRYLGSMQRTLGLAGRRRRNRPAVSRRVILNVMALENRLVPATASAATTVAAYDAFTPAEVPPQTVVPVSIELDGTVTEMTPTGKSVASFEIDKKVEIALGDGSAETSLELEKSFSLKIDGVSADVELKLEGIVGFKLIAAGEEVSVKVGFADDFMQKGRGQLLFDSHGLIGLLKSPDGSASPLASLDVEQKCALQPEAGESKASLDVADETSYKRVPGTSQGTLNSAGSSDLACPSDSSNQKVHTDESDVLTYTGTTTPVSIQLDRADDLMVGKKAHAADSKNDIALTGDVAGMRLADTSMVDDSTAKVALGATLSVEGAVASFQWGHTQDVTGTAGSEVSSPQWDYLVSPVRSSAETSPPSLTAHFDTVASLDAKKSGFKEVIRTHQDDTGAIIAIDVAETLGWWFAGG